MVWFIVSCVYGADGDIILVFGFRKIRFLARCALYLRIMHSQCSRSRELYRKSVMSSLWSDLRACS